MVLLVELLELELGLVGLVLVVIGSGVGASSRVMSFLMPLVLKV